MGALEPGKNEVRLSAPPPVAAPAPTASEETVAMPNVEAVEAPAAINQSQAPGVSSSGQLVPQESGGDMQDMMVMANWVDSGATLPHGSNLV